VVVESPGRVSQKLAFAYIRRISQDRNVKLRDVCVALVAEFDAARRAGADGKESPAARLHSSPAAPQ
jgi:hypothetical protein